MVAMLTKDTRHLPFWIAEGNFKVINALTMSVGQLWISLLSFRKEHQSLSKPSAIGTGLLPMRSNAEIRYRRCKPYQAHALAANLSSADDQHPVLTTRPCSPGEVIKDAQEDAAADQEQEIEDENIKELRTGDFPVCHEKRTDN
jgi:hypothetical protein